MYQTVVHTFAVAILIPALRGIMRSQTILQILLRGIVYVLLGTMSQL